MLSLPLRTHEKNLPQLRLQREVWQISLASFSGFSFSFLTISHLDVLLSILFWVVNDVSSTLNFVFKTLLFCHQNPTNPKSIFLFHHNLIVEVRFAFIYQTVEHILLLLHNSLSPLTTAGKHLSMLKIQFNNQERELVHPEHEVLRQFFALPYLLWKPLTLYPLVDK